MKIEARREGIERLSQFVRRLRDDGALSRDAYKIWRKDAGNIDWMTERFAYPFTQGVPALPSLIALDFHPIHPLVMLNYSTVAHNTLHAYPQGWTNALRMCRGIVFDHHGNLLAHPFPKFFNLGEHPEAQLDALLADQPDDFEWFASDKLDGHLGIIFSYRDELLITTRGRFQSPTSMLAAPMLQRHARDGWKRTFPEDWTVTVEIIHPSTKVHVEYTEAQHGFVMTGAFNRVTLEDASPARIQQMANALSIPFADPQIPASVLDTLASRRRTSAGELRAIIEHMKDRGVRNKEGFVLRIGDTRVKVKYATYIQLMVAAKLSPSYLMRRIMGGSLHRMLSTLDAEIVTGANEMLGRIMRVLFMSGTIKERRQYLYGLVPPEQSTQYYRGICREFLAFAEGHHTFPIKP